MQAPLAITLGDPAGIGPEIIVKAYAQAPELMQGCVVFGDAAHLRRACEVVGAGLRVHAVNDSSHLPSPDLTLPVIDVAAPGQPMVPLVPLVPFGRLSAQGGALAAQAVVAATQAALRGKVAGLVTAPLNKEALAAGGWGAYPGHTELLQALCAKQAGVPVAQMPVRMMLANDQLRTVLVSIHVPLRQAIDLVTTERVLETLSITHHSLSQLLGRAPRIAVAGLNPHAGEGGLFGSEDQALIAPAIEQACAQGMQASGPHAPDTVFMRARQGEFDVVVAMYHDQGLIPVKYLGLDEGVNVTLGLPVVRTSPDHGTAFDLAGTGRADPASLLAAVRMARQLIQRP